MKITSVKLNALTALTLVFSLGYSSCAPQTQRGFDTGTQAASEDSSNIVGGQVMPASFQKQNGIVALAITSSGLMGGNLSICSGTLIDKRIVLTAAHCIQSERGSRITNIDVYFIPDIQQSLSSGSLKFSIPADKKVQNPAFLKGTNDQNVNSTAWNDVALIRLKTDAPVGFNIAKIARLNSLRLTEKDSVILAGFGIATPIVSRSQINPKTGLEEVVAVPEKSSSAGILRKIENIPVLAAMNDKELIFDQSNSTGACHGDSGGPAFFKQADGSLVQVGITSRGTNRLGNCNEQAIYTSVAAQGNWIESTKAALLRAK